MNINLLQLKKQLKQRRQQRLYESKPLGSAIKFKRRQMNMTLEEGAEGICSVSYLSKLENNLIEVGERFVDQLIDRFDLKEVEDASIEQYHGHKLMLVDHMVRQTLPEDTIASYGERHDVQAQLIRMVHHTSQGRSDLALRSYHDVRLYLPRLHDDEVGLFLYCLHDMLSKAERYQDAYELLLLIPEKALMLHKMKLLVMRGKLKNAFAMHRLSEIMTSYKPYIRLSLELQHYHLVHEIEADHLKFETAYQPLEHILDKLAVMQQINQRDASLIHRYGLFHQHRYEAVIELSEANAELSVEGYKLYLLAVDQRGDQARMQRLLKADQPSYKPTPSLYLLLRHLHYKYLSEKEEMLSYLRSDILGVKHISDDYLLLHHLMVDAQKLFSRYHYYKEAVQVTSKLLPVIRHLQKRPPNESPTP